ncbi:hypothetical protein PFBG_01193 [Plasmodium falciparum 7G8]|uniref:Apicoplast TIC22 protein n=1 Tax=Plasmodium falciparum (isolate 7G8) TaxID=57266 RepID=W7F5R8_PLAF8|nr:hypothetical protein PFBG_01193 [Plasmodium falciparum 7G8]
MCLLLFICLYLARGIYCLKTLNGLSRDINNSIYLRNNVHKKKRLVDCNLCMLKHKFRLSFWKKRYDERPIEEKLEVIPVFLITNYNSSPYIFQENEKQVCYMFLCPYDAENMLNDMIKYNGMKYNGNIKIHNITMKKAYELMKEFLQLEKMEVNKEDSKKKQNIYWKLISSKRQLQNALYYLSFTKKSELMYPVFYAENLYIQKDGSNIIPLFFDLEDLKEAIEEQKNKALSKVDYKIKVLNMVDLIFTEDHKKFGFVPSTQSVKYLDKLNIGTKKTYF